MRTLFSLLAVLFVLTINSVPLFAQGLTDLGPHDQSRRSLERRELVNPDHWMAIIGDSGTTGAASRQDIEPRGLNLLGHALQYLFESRMSADLPRLSDYPNPERFNITQIEPMTRVLYSEREYREAVNKGTVRKLNLGAKGSLKVDSMEQGFGYMVGRGLGIAARDIVLVGQDGKQINVIPEQFERIFEMNTKTLPPLVFVSFTANDFCHVSALTDNLVERSAEFANRLKQAWKSSEPFMTAHAKGTRIVVLAPLEVANVLTNPEILRQEVNFQGVGRITCGQLRERTHADGLLTRRTSESLVGMCRSVLGTHPSDVNRLNRLRAIQSAFNDVWKAQIAALNTQFREKGIRFQYLEEIRHMDFKTGDVAADCFHPGVRGHAKLAEVILRFLQNPPESL